ncbi:transketolase C-terminal domain-containing protein [Croceicoccus sp. F390]|uniref:1-deoxy-D-xylulose-5-phosphate synthase n=1 Tax=Croceicoccus esteveae TaxID=3075597 RepID=A0ABU2ZNW5_9SPHN|nr:transketolase C-terminal domain-containing protein [Croceicoccus sp. F390]MDT0577127.1 transketolase C-terminal domain-containing protein [Croceicoccus sp. F390]
MSNDSIDMVDPFSFTSAAEVEDGAVIGQTLIELAQERDDIVLIAPDVGRGPATTSFIDAFPDRYIDTGIAENNAVSIAAGLAASGFRPVVFGIGAFMAPKCLEQIRTDIAINRLPVTLIAAWGGLDMGYFGASHHGLEDISMLRGTPYLTIMSAADDHAMRTLMRDAITGGMPTYIRAPSGAARAVYDASPDFDRGGLQTIRDGSDILLIGTGLGTSLCIAAAAILEEQGMSAQVVDAPYLKPFDQHGICRLALAAHNVLVVEEHNVTCGLASLVAEALGRGGVARPMHAIGLPDGDLAVAVPDQLFARYNLTAEAIASKAQLIIR